MESRSARSCRIIVLGILLILSRATDGCILQSPHDQSSTNRVNTILFSSSQQTPYEATSRPSTPIKNDLLDLLFSVPSNAPTSPSLTSKILSAVRQLENECPTPNEDVLAELAGNWELMWTAQDKTSAESQRGPFSWINPLENQSYSNNPFQKSKRANAEDGGRANPILPREIQDRLEQIGILEPSGQNDKDASPVRSSQAIDLKRSRVRNVVSVTARRPLPAKGSLIVDVAFKPNNTDNRKIDVKFDSCRLQLQNSPIDITFPLGIIGPTGWLRTAYIDEDMRITRGHKGSVFILSRTAKRKNSNGEG